ncbi:hypothetical protein K435DRAFT_791143 [Dendrothele bispora CBS 962.96]|uniref:Uncharacterized protein n=1 Tax=Dendrothele bispora (strain CBS 962.96) TaxID=1314807 RepID=A0A4S8MMY1_DENBC|nr:hypothetical protein K435DRAFT_791143 [Dendrothele bispora CBS 962.96]
MPNSSYSSFCVFYKLWFVSAEPKQSAAYNPNRISEKERIYTLTITTPPPGANTRESNHFEDLNILIKLEYLPSKRVADQLGIEHPSTATTGTEGDRSSPDDSSKYSINIPALIGGVVGGSVFLALLVLLQVIYYWCQYDKEDKLEVPDVECQGAQDPDALPLKA